MKKNIMGLGFLFLAAGGVIFPNSACVFCADKAVSRQAKESRSRENIKFKQERSGLEQEIESLKDNFKKERAELYEKLGTAYVQARLYDLAIDAYEKSLTCDFRNPEVHYNLGLLYKKSEDNSKEAIYHLKKYLWLNPKAKNREEVRYFINMLAEKGKWDIEAIL